MKNKIAISVFLVLFAALTSLGQLVNDAKFRDITKLLNQYEQYSQFTLDGNSIDAGYANNFLNLFDPIPFQKFYNDLNAGKEESSSFGSAQEYMQVITKNYSFGVDVSLDMSQVKVVDVFQSKVQKGYIVMVSKKSAGLFRGKKVFRSNTTMYMFVSEMIGDKGSIFKIAGILDPVSYQKYQGNNTIKGLYAGLAGGYGTTMVVNEGALNNYETYQVENERNMSFGFELSYMFTRSFGLGTGVGMNTYSSQFIIDSYNEQSATSIIDQDGDRYNPILVINEFTETDVYKSIEIPILFKFRSGKGRTAFYIDMGVIYSLISGYYTQEGSSSRSGYYPEWQVTLEDIPEYDFYTNKSLSGEETDLVTPPNGLFTYVALGVSIPLAQNIYMKMGANLRNGITDMQLNENYHSLGLSDFISDPGQTILRGGGIEIGVSYNLWSSLIK